MSEPLKIYKALADETRLRLLRLLARGALNVNEVIDIVQMGQSRVSRHLKILADADLVISRREGTWIYYQTNPTGPTSVAGALDHLAQHEQQIPFYTADLQALQGVIEKRRAQTRRFFDSISQPDELPQHQSLDGAFYRRIALQQLDIDTGTILDLGTGAGLLLPPLLQKADGLIAVDSSTAMLDMARQTVGPDSARVDFRLGDLEHLPVADAEVDAVVACMVLHHLSRPELAIAEARRALKPGGLLVVVDLQRHTDESLRETQADLWLGFEPPQIETWLQNNHFTVIGAETFGEPDALQLITFQGKKQ
jgi:ubiquinone/menaquinone biosynthesis C-methylase UbiE